MNAEPRRIRGGLARQAHLGVDVIATTPGRAQALERGPVGETTLCQSLVQAVHRQRLGPLRRPHPQIDQLARTTACQRAGRMPGPRPVSGVILWPRVHRDRTAAVFVLSAHRDLNLKTTLFRQHQWCREDQVLHHLAAHLLAGPNREFEHGGAGE